MQITENIEVESNSLSSVKPSRGWRKSEIAYTLALGYIAIIALISMAQAGQDLYSQLQTSLSSVSCH